MFTRASVLHKARISVDNFGVVDSNRLDNFYTCVAIRKYLEFLTLYSPFCLLMLKLVV